MTLKINYSTFKVIGLDKLKITDLFILNDKLYMFIEDNDQDRAQVVNLTDLCCQWLELQILVRQVEGTLTVVTK